MKCEQCGKITLRKNNSYLCNYRWMSTKCCKEESKEFAASALIPKVPVKDLNIDWKIQPKEPMKLSKKIPLRFKLRMLIIAIKVAINHLVMRIFGKSD